MFCFTEPPLRVQCNFLLCFFDAEFARDCNFCISRGNGLIDSSIVFCLSFFNQTSSYCLVKHAAVGNIPNMVLHLSQLFPWEARELCKSSNTDTWRQEQTLVPHLERRRGKSWNIKCECEERKKWKGEKKEARLVLMHVRVASAAEQGQEVVESVWGRNKGSLLHGSLPQLGGTLSHSYEVWPPQTIKQTPFTLLDFIWNHAVEWITQRQPGI